MTTIYDFLKFKQEIKELHEHVASLSEQAANPEPWRAEIKELRGLVASLSEQVVLLQKQVSEKATLPGRKITLYAGRCLSHCAPPEARPTLLVKYNMHLQNSTGVYDRVTSRLAGCERSLSIVENGAGTIYIPSGHTLRILSSVWYPPVKYDGGIHMRSTSTQVQSLPISEKLRYEYLYSCEVSTNGGEI
jgi:hypothetical protein